MKQIKDMIRRIIESEELQKMYGSKEVKDQYDIFKYLLQFECITVFDIKEKNIDITISDDKVFKYISSEALDVFTNGQIIQMDHYNIVKEHTVIIIINKAKNKYQFIFDKHSVNDNMDGIWYYLLEFMDFYKKYLEG